MNLTTALTEAARVAVAEGKKYDMFTPAGKIRVCVVCDATTGEAYKRGTETKCKEWIAARVNAAVFAWWAENWDEITQLEDDVACLSPSAAIFHVLSALANGESS